MWVSIASDAACAAALQQAVVDFGLVDTDALQAVLQIPESAAGLARALCTALCAAPPAAEIGTMTDVALTGNVVDTSTAEAMIDEALCMVDEAEARERAAEERAHRWLTNAELVSVLLRKAEDRTDRAQAGRQAAEVVAAAERAARQAMEQMLKAEAALADAALSDAESERSAPRVATPRHKGTFTRRLLGRAGTAEAAEVVVGMRHRRRQHHRHRRRHHRHRRHLRLRRHLRHRHRCLS